MVEISVRRILLLVVSLAKCLEGTKLLAHLKKCGDLECETLISRVLALRDHTGPDCQYLNFTKGDEISVYVKLSGEREDLWAGSKGKDFGFFPRDAVQIEEVFISEEVEMPTKESDFLCLLGEGYIFGSEHSELNSEGDGNMYPSEEDEDQEYNIYESDFQLEPDFYAASEGTLFEDQISASEAGEEFRVSSESADWDETGHVGNGEQGYTPDLDHALPSLSTSETQGWFGLGKEEAKEKAFEADTDPTQESSFQSRKLTVEENDLEKLNNGEPQMELEQDPKPQFDSETPEFSPVPEEQYELVSESENSLKPQATGWFDSGFTRLLGFGEEDAGLELLSKESNPPLQDVLDSVSPDEEAPAPFREMSADKEDTVINDNSTPGPSWFDFSFGMLGLAYADEDKRISDNRKREDGEVDNYKHPVADDIDPGKEQERGMITVVETEDQVGKERALEKRDDSDSMQYLKKFFHNPWSFQSLPEDPELPLSTQMLDQDNRAENDKTERLSTENSATESMKDPVTLEDRYSLSDMTSEVELPLRVHEGIHFKTSSSKRSEEDSESWVDSEGPAVAETDMSVEGALLHSQLVSQKEEIRFRNYIPKHDAEFQILKYLFQIDIYGFMNLAFSSTEILIERVVAALPEDMTASFDSSGASFQLVICVLTLGLLAVFLLLWRGFRSIQSRFYVGKEKRLALELSVLMEEKCKLLEKVSLAQKEYEGLESSLKEANFDKAPTEAQSLEVTYENLERDKSKLEDEILLLEKKLEEERAKHNEQNELMTDISKSIQSLEDESKSVKTQVAEAKTTLRIFEINEERLQGIIKDTLNENSQLQESQKELLQEAEVMKEQADQLNNQKVTFEESKVQAEQVLNDKENQIKSLMESLLKMKDWTSVFGEDVTDDGNLDLEVKSDLENDVHLGNQPKGALKKLIYATKLSASLKALEGERNQNYTQLSEVDKANDDLTECIRSLESEQVSLQSANSELEKEKQKLQQKLTVMTELYQDNEMKLHRKLTVEENCRLEKEEKLSKVDERISHATKELETYRQRAKDVEEELERTIRSYQGQVIAHEKKAHDNWLAARTLERNINDLRKENALNRQKLTEAEFKFELLEKDPYAPDIPNTAFGREHSPYGPSPLGRPSSETRAFLSPPTLLEGPLRLSPLLPGGGGRGSRGPQNPLDHQMNTERGETSYNRLSDAPRAPSDRSLSPPWEQDRRMMAPPPDGPGSSKLESRKNDTKGDPGNSTVPNSPPAECETAGPGFIPPPVPQDRVPRGPLFAEDPRSPIMSWPLPFPPPPPAINLAVPPGYFTARDFSGPPFLPPPRDFPGLPFAPYPEFNSAQFSSC
ncbi:melanoma inhibitory activity protein 2 isoform X2 [Cricetulus griseus]|uniref:melanoma inhibitory activity protein 2 isoform X2 n=1 Tax=Cricetulus griseus TaxID=10029 RepID=UPI0015C30A95|nr:melanoma inhibitory activity protein 2 isoform X2 [Cricetulus griseus]